MNFGKGKDKTILRNVQRPTRRELWYNESPVTKVYKPFMARNVFEIEMSIIVITDNVCTRKTNKQFKYRIWIMSSNTPNSHSLKK